MLQEWGMEQVHLMAQGGRYVQGSVGQRLPTIQSYLYLNDLWRVPAATAQNMARRTSADAPTPVRSSC